MHKHLEVDYFLMRYRESNNDIKNSASNYEVIIIAYISTPISNKIYKLIYCFQTLTHMITRI